MGNNFKLVWKVMADGWTSIRRLCLLNDRELPIWCSKEHLHVIDNKQFEEDFKFLIDRYGLKETDRLNIQENVISARVT